MNKETVYAVVDIETTGTSVADGDRIIQIGCVFVQHNKIINRFATDINPEREVPMAIQRLTGISNQRVKKAPLFDDIAGTLYGLLAETVFVAHNVNFDFPFINAELARVGFPELAIEAIDTVSLSQILLPTATSFRLRDLSARFQIEHDNPHSADSDAAATAQLFIYLLRRLRGLPMVTLQTMVALNPALPRETSQLFNVAIALNSPHPRSLPDYLYIKNGLALRRRPPLPVTPLNGSARYPKTKKQKLALYPDTLAWRPEQARMMNAIFKNYADEDQHPVQNLMVEAPTGIGKSLGYLLPMSYLASQTGRQVVVSTATTVLQEQLLTQSIPVLNEILPEPIQAVVVKGRQHYIDLNRFATTLKAAEPSKQTQLLKLRLLVWLTMTTTGDLDELHLATYGAPYFQEIIHQAPVDEHEPFFEDDFIRQRDQRLLQATVVIVNHAYLSEHARTLGDRLHQPYLVVDEAQHLTESAVRQRRVTVRFSRLINQLHQIDNLLAHGHGHDIQHLFADDSLGFQATTDMLQASEQLTDQLTHLVQILFRQFMAHKRPAANEQPIEDLVAQDQLAGTMTAEEASLAQLANATNQLLNTLATLHQRFDAQQDRWLASDHYRFNRLEQDVHQFDRTMGQLFDVLAQLQDEDTATLFWLSMSHTGDRSSLALSAGLLVTEGYLQQNVYAAFQPVLLTGATLFSSKRAQYALDAFDLDRETTQTHRFRSSFDYAHQSRLLVATDGPDVTQISSEGYTAYLAEAIERLVTAERRQTMVLFTSLATISGVYERLIRRPGLQHREILAQGISGSRERMTKRFASGDGAILLGATSFWEGIDLPEDRLELLIVTRLPFDSPDQLFVKAEFQRLERQGKNPFYNLSLPKATLRLRQGVGRLIRTPRDRGAVVVLDDRLITRPYGQSMQRALPAELPIISGSLEEVRTGLINFFEKKSVGAEASDNF